MSLTGQKACMGILPHGRDTASSWTRPKPVWTTLPPCSTLKPARSGFRKVSSSTESDSCPIPGLAEGVLEMRVKEGSKIRNLLGFAMARMQGDVQRGGRPALSQILFTGSGRAITKTITCAEIMKRQLRGLHQLSKLQYCTVREQWQARDSASSNMTLHRLLPAIYILLSKEPLDPKEPGYQPPVELDLSEPGYQNLVELDPNEPGYQPPVGMGLGLDLNERGYQCPVELDLRAAGYQGLVEFEPNEPGYQPPLVLQNASESRKSEEHLQSAHDHKCMLGYNPPAEPFTPSHPRQPAELLPSLSSDSQSVLWASRELESGSDCSKQGRQPSSEPCPLPHPYRAGQELCIHEEERGAQRWGSRKRRFGPCSLSCQPQTKAALFEDGNI